MGWRRGGIAVLVGLVGCGPLVPVGSPEETTSDESTSSTSGDTRNPGTSSSTTAGPFTTAPPVTTVDPDPTISTGSSSEGTGGMLPNGSQCMSHEECWSGMCYFQGILGGICGDCLSDADCVWGCTGPNPVSDPPLGSYCNQGLFGDGCESTDACMGQLLCATILDVPGVLKRSTCGDCISDADCPPEGLCSPDLQIAELDGVWRCIAPGFKPLGGFCNLLESGDQQCASGVCGVADIMGLFVLGVCSECRLDTDCSAGETCVAPTVDLDGTVAAGYCG